MEPYQLFWSFFRSALAWSITIAAVPFITFPWGVLAYKIWHGNKEIDEELSEEMWPRAGWASFYMLLVAVACLLLDYATIDWLAVPTGPVHLVYFIVFVSLAAWVMMYCFSMEDFFQGLSLAVLYLYIPAALFVVLWWLTKWNWLFTYVLGWLKDPTTA